MRPASTFPDHASPAAVTPPDPAALRRMGLEDLPYVVRAHANHFPDGLFARLGPRFLTRYYRTFLDGPTAVAVIAEVDGSPAGYLTGVLRTRQHRQLLLRHHGPALAVTGCAALVRRPRVAYTFIATRLPRYVQGLKRDLGGPAAVHAATPPGTPTHAANLAAETAVLSNVVVDGPRRHRGLGTRLVQHFLTQATDAGCSCAALVTVAETGAGKFYEHLGWTRAGGTVTAEGTALWRYNITLPVPLPLTLAAANGSAPTAQDRP